MVRRDLLLVPFQFSFFLRIYLAKRKGGQKERRGGGMEWRGGGSKRMKRMINVMLKSIESEVRVEWREGGCAHI
ncbi:MAG: hypothetical protein JOS17DRAFT_114171 [Linnemannia elongata]|nr:MAG: hypothetical protein JOS17DRAFT_114171 [Linnemannia elongata]